MHKSQIEDINLASYQEYFCKYNIYHYPDNKFAFCTYCSCKAESKWRKYAFSLNNEKDLLV